MDYSQYSPDWRTIIRPAILKRDDYSCRHCGIKNHSRVYRDSKGNYVVCDEFTEQWAVSNGKNVKTLSLQVAHIDHDKQNNDPANLLTLCPRCHARFDAEYKKIKRIALLEKVQVNKPIDSLPELAMRDSLITGIRTGVRMVTKLKITKDEANIILIQIFKQLNNESN